MIQFLKKKWRPLCALCGIGILAGLVAVWIMGGSLCAPSRSSSGNLPADFHGEVISFKSYSGVKISGWFVPGIKNRGAVILMHGVRSNRGAMLSRASFLREAGYAVLLFDFQAHGKSEGDHITFGFLESQDARAAVDFLHTPIPGEKIAVLGVSMGGAAAALAEPPLPVDALILEMVYPTIAQAVEDRMKLRCGPFGSFLAPLLTLQLKPRLGCGPDDLRPIDKVKMLKEPKLFIAGTKDLHTTFTEAQELFQAAAEPKESMWVEGAAHEDLHKFSKSDYEKAILGFLNARLQ